MDAEPVQLFPLQESTDFNNNKWITTGHLVVDKELRKKLTYCAAMLIENVFLQNLQGQSAGNLYPNNFF